MEISPKTVLTAIIGNPVEHSLSPTLHNAVYKTEQIDAVMLAFGSPDIAGLVAAIRTLPIQLAAVTMPHKQTIMPLLDGIDVTAKDIGAVNTVVNRNGVLTGYNTDVTGVAKALAGVTLKDANVLLIGAGGAARTVAYHATREGAHVFCHNRKLAEAEALRASFDINIIGEDGLGATDFDVIVNATPIGMSPNTDAMPVPEEIIRKDAAVFDLVYSPLETKLLKTARARGSRAIRSRKKPRRRYYRTARRSGTFSPSRTRGCSVSPAPAPHGPPRRSSS